MDLSFDQIVLNKLELSFLETLRDSDTWVHEKVMPEKLDIDRLIELNFVEKGVFADETFYLITNWGIVYLNFYKRAAARYKTELFFSILAAILSVVSLAISAISLRMQL